MQYLPFKNNTFDYALFSYSLAWVKSGVKNCLKEAIRVTKSDGRVCVCPVDTKPRLQWDLEKTREKLKGLPVKLVRRLINNGTETVLTLDICKQGGLNEDDWQHILNKLTYHVDFNRIARVDEVIWPKNKRARKI